MRRRPILVTGALVVLLSSCGATEGGNDATAATGPSAVVAALCDAERRAVSGDVEGSRTVFEDRAHAPLHRVAADLQDRDAALAAPVLEAKQAVEEALAQSVDGESLAARLAGLNGALQASLAASGTPVGGCG